MNPTDTSFNRQPTNSPGAKTQEPAKQALEFGREVKGQATELAKTATETVKTQAANLTEFAKDVASDAGEKLRTTLQEQKAAGADYVGNVASIIRRTAHELTPISRRQVTTSARPQPSSKMCPRPCETAICRKS